MHYSHKTGKFMEHGLVGFNLKNEFIGQSSALLYFLFLIYFAVCLYCSVRIHQNNFQVRDPMPAVYFFLIDVSMNAIQTGATAAACSAISQAISDLPVSSVY